MFEILNNIHLSFYFKNETIKKDKPTPEESEEPQSCPKNTSDVCSLQVTEICIDECENVQFPNVKEDENLDFDFFDVSSKEEVVSTNIGIRSSKDLQHQPRINTNIDQIKRHKNSNITSPRFSSIWRPFEDIKT